MSKELGSASELYSPSADSLPPYSSTWNVNAAVGDEEKRTNQERWDQSKDFLRRTTSAALTQIKTIPWSTLSSRIFRWPSEKQAIAFALLLLFGVTPLAILALTTKEPEWEHTPFYGIFDDKVLGCGDSFGTPENATVSGIEKIFVLDKTFGKFSFSTAKTIDVAWDILIGRCVQMLAWWVGYSVFCDALLRAIERHPASFRIFQRIALEGPSLISLWTLTKEICTVKSKRTKLLFFHIWISTIHIICIPLFLSAMTGYDSTSIPWISLEDENNIVPAAAVSWSWAITKVQNVTLAAPFCIDTMVFARAANAYDDNRRHCE